MPARTGRTNSCELCSHNAVAVDLLLKKRNTFSHVGFLYTVLFFYFIRRFQNKKTNTEQVILQLIADTKRTTGMVWPKKTHKTDQKCLIRRS